ncbi:pur operon repressor [Shouchella clausii]|jgi:purine operon repressor|uniref:Transcriptional repressor of the purine operon n=3 Tax=Shouchella TaxID=2893057 RepID=Q5WAD1_SHOC1|nr:MULTISPECIES: pur operon repressor [Shouchella]MCM3314708.1 pur operon repressor [Psychrobacillus sp. MER TA 17]ALA52806.1 PurR: transcription regulator associated with purine metabolism [Shouchella clausii]KKI85819.1 purine operon repressor [Shouchella clausii]MBU3233064.1 pur operon repressor [Shouchella clausii]MBU3266036.1 pur operon repressor [Shouchella clausii]
MKKLKRSGRLVDMTHFLLQHPHEIVSLTHFSERYQAAKSSISEDLVIIKDMFEEEGYGALVTIPGASGGVKFMPKMNKQEAEQLIGELVQALNKQERILPGGYLYMMDLLGNPKLMHKVGRLFAAVLADKEIDAVMTVATKGIPLAYAVGHYLGVPVSIVRRDHRITEGSMVSINYASGSSDRIQTMTLARRSLAPGSKVFIVDDFMKAGGTLRGMVDLLEEFEADLVGIGVLVESAEVSERLVDDYLSLTKLTNVNVREKVIDVTEGNILTKLETS